ncbi:MAG: hypothetical protein ACI4M9_02385 [Succinivibrio sp.]
MCLIISSFCAVFALWAYAEYKSVSALRLFIMYVTAAGIWALNCTYDVLIGKNFWDLTLNDVGTGLVVAFAGLAVEGAIRGFSALGVAETSRS